jgi:hypothetical protein
MERLVIYFIPVLLLSACAKVDLKPGADSDELNQSSDALTAAPPCNVSNYTSTVFTGVSFGNGLTKTYYKSGLVKSVRSMITRNHDYADSVIYSMVYYTSSTGMLMATVTCLKKHYAGVGLGSPAPLFLYQEQYRITATLDPANHRLVKIFGTNDPVTYEDHPSTKAGYYVMQYNGNRLLKFGSIELKYDSLGNVTWIPKRPPATAKYSVLYQYNHAKKAAHQYYITSGYSVHEYYNLAEACNWIPVQPNSLRIRHSMFWGNYHAGDLFFDQHVVDANGYLVSYRNRMFNHTIVNTWKCPL